MPQKLNTIHIPQIKLFFKIYYNIDSQLGFSKIPLMSCRPLIILTPQLDESFN